MGELQVTKFNNRHMKKNKIELDVDFIGSQQPITAKEQKELSDYFKSSKLKTKKTKSRSSMKDKTLTKV
jgi:hypothetical protein